VGGKCLCPRLDGPKLPLPFLTPSCNLTISTCTPCRPLPRASHLTHLPIRCPNAPNGTLQYDVYQQTDDGRIVVVYSKHSPFPTATAGGTVVQVLILQAISHSECVVHGRVKLR